jgi:hypothetical protein
MKDTQNTARKSNKAARRSYTLAELLNLTRKKSRANDKTSSDNFGEKLAEKALERIRNEVVI